MNYYHITDKKNAPSILSNGLKANSENEIFIFENKSIINRQNGVINTVSDCIAKNQIFLKEYVMFEIDSKGFKTPLINDDVGELSAKQQFILKQPKIEPKYINVFGTFKTDYKPFMTIADFEIKSKK